ncbi:MAG: hypothetical protein SGJ19_23330 [Planctomycetia bacterium]|nr:hypothetical protein [Planctomycetia bacterium]
MSDNPYQSPQSDLPPPEATAAKIAQSSVWPWFVVRMVGAIVGGTILAFFVFMFLLFVIFGGPR